MKRASKKRICPIPRTTVILIFLILVDAFTFTDAFAAAPQVLQGTTATTKVSKWDGMMNRLREYHSQRGHTAVTIADDPELYRWTHMIRRNYRHQAESRGSGSSSSRRPRLSMKRLAQLESVEFLWDVQEQLWLKRYQQLQTFHAKYGHCRVPNNSLEFPQLGVWVRNQRREYKRLEHGEPSTLSTDRLARLEALDFAWYRSHTEAWENHYEQLKDFVAKYGHANVPEAYPANPSLGQWCMNQRTTFRLLREDRPSAMTPRRIALLEKIGFQWQVRDFRWEEMKERLMHFYHGHGHLNIPDSEEYGPLRAWLIRQRYYYKRRKEGLSSSMTRDRIHSLESAIPNFSWQARGNNGPSVDDWAKLFDAMRAKGLKPGMRPKKHWFEGENRFSADVKHVWTEQELLALWNQEDEEDDDT